MLKKIIQVTSILLLSGFSFFYTEKVTKIVRNNDPIMIKINEVKDELEVTSLEPIIIDDEFIAGVNGCTVDVTESYNKMKTVGEFKEELLVMSEVKNNKSSKDKYIISGNKKKKNVSIIFIITNKLDINLVGLLNSKRIHANFFIDRKYLIKNSNEIRDLSNSHYIYYYGENGIYSEKNMVYDNNIININANNESKYCLTPEKNSKILKLCTDYDMKTIKTTYLTDNVITNIKKTLTNGNIIVFNTNNIEDIQTSINYILSKGYKIVGLDDLLNENEICN